MMPSWILSMQSLATNSSQTHYPRPSWLYSLFPCSHQPAAWSFSPVSWIAPLQIPPLALGVSLIGCSSPQLFPGACNAGLLTFLTHRSPHSDTALLSLHQLSAVVPSVQHSCNDVPSSQLPGICSLLLQTPFSPGSPCFPRTSQNTRPVSFEFHRLWDGG